MGVELSPASEHLLYQGRLGLPLLRLKRLEHPFTFRIVRTPTLQRPRRTVLRRLTFLTLSMPSLSSLCVTHGA